MAILFTLCFFLLRDFLLLTMGPKTKLLARFLLYAGGLLASELLFSVATLSLSTEQVLQVVRSPRFILPLALFYSVLAVLCLWFLRTDRHDMSWLIAVVPNPLVVIGIAIVARLVAVDGSGTVRLVGPSLLVSVWIALISLSVRAARNTPRDVPELDFSLGLAGIVTAIPLVALPVESFLMNTNDWSEFLR